MRDIKKNKLNAAGNAGRTESTPYAAGNTVRTERGKAGHYGILLSRSASHYERHAAAELKYFYYEATGVYLVITEVGEEEIPSESRVFVIGDRLLKASLPDYCEKIRNMKACGYIVKSSGNRVFLCGGRDIGTLYAVYGLLNRLFGLEVYAEDEIFIRRGIENPEIGDIDIEECPDIPFRNGFGQRYYFYPKNAHRMRFDVNFEIFIKDSFQPWHNSFRYFPPEQYNNPDNPAEYHPEWYIESGLQLDYLCRGNADSVEEMRAMLTDKMIRAIEKSFGEGKYYELIAFTHEDFPGWSNDVSMDTYRKKYGEGAAAATLIHFLNPVARNLKEYMAKHWDGRPMTVITFAYLDTAEPPVISRDGKNVPTDDSVILEDNLSVLYAPIYADYTESLLSEKNKLHVQRMDKWITVSKSISFWIYGSNFHHKTAFFNDYGNMQDNFRLMKRYNAYYSFDNTASGNWGNVSFSALKEYLGAKLQWNVSLDARALIEDFFPHYYRDAAPEVKRLFDELRGYYSYLKSEKGFTIDNQTEKSFWPEEKLLYFLSIVGSAYRKIDVLRSHNKELYNIIYDRICGDSIMLRWLLLKYYGESFSVSELEWERRLFKEDCDRLGIHKFSTLQDGNSIEFVTRDWSGDPKQKLWI